MTIKGSPPPPRPHGKRRLLPARRTVPPPRHLRAEFLRDEEVLIDATDEFLDDELVVESERPLGESMAGGRPEVIFAGTSDAPPARSALPTPAAAAHPARKRFALSTRTSGRRSGGHWQVVVAATAAAAAAAVSFQGIRGPRGHHATALASRGVLGALHESAASPQEATSHVGASTWTEQEERELREQQADEAGAKDPTAEERALEEQKAAQEQLEHGRTSKAVEIALRSLAIDSTDAESWLILGAAYLQQGKRAEARGAFTSCVNQATRGPLAECVALQR